MGLLVVYFLLEYGWCMMLFGVGIIFLVVLLLVVVILFELINYLKGIQLCGVLQCLNCILCCLGELGLSVLLFKVLVCCVLVGVIFQGGWLVGMLCLWFSIIMGFMMFYFLVLWIMQFLVQVGLVVENVIYVGVLFNFGGFIGIFVISSFGVCYGL